MIDSGVPVTRSRYVTKKQCDKDRAPSITILELDDPECADC